jgi:hypothetical protein
MSRHIPQPAAIIRHQKLFTYGGWHTLRFIIYGFHAWRFGCFSYSRHAIIPTLLPSLDGQHAFDAAFACDEPDATPRRLTWCLFLRFLRWLLPPLIPATLATSLFIYCPLNIAIIFHYTHFRRFHWYWRISLLPHVTVLRHCGAITASFLLRHTTCHYLRLTLPQ